MSELKLAEIAIVVSHREKSAALINDLLTQYGEYIIARMGVPHRQKQLNLISIVLEAPAEKIDELYEKLTGLSNVQVKILTI
ncbi:MAG: iron-only hydrogenase system regulator [Alphaproteobacteria bacterium]|nr:iron-only hydrogenase system regulator [Alphaproteobacteria bacterium]